MRLITSAALMLSATVLIGCGGASAPVDQPASPRDAGNVSTFVGKIWQATDAAAAPGTLRIFLADGSLVMVSCVEPYRLVRWTALDATRIAWQEDTARIEAEVVEAESERLHLRLLLESGVEDQHFQLASVPTVCPDWRPSPAGHRQTALSR